MDHESKLSRRAFAQASAAAALSFAGSSCASVGARGSEMEISPAEDLMREHGVLKRLLLVYGEGARRLTAGTDLPLQPIADAADMIRTFVEDYHERLEEDFLFPRFRAAGVQVELVDVLTAQHAAGRRLTERIARATAGGTIGRSEDREALAEGLRAFVRMYEPHEAREDTVLFPALRSVFDSHEYDELGEAFEDKEHALFGEDGFERMVARVADIEKRLGIHELAQFTPA